MNIIPIELSVTNCYLVPHGSQYILADTGYEVDWNLFCKQLKKAKIDFSQISHIILTHHDDDHSGLLNHIVKQNNSVKIVMSYLAKDLLATGQDDRSHGKKLINKRLELLWAFSLKRPEPFAPPKQECDSREPSLRFLGQGGQGHCPSLCILKDCLHLPTFLT
jgi:Uncharacterized flavoproteins